MLLASCSSRYRYARIGSNREGTAIMPIRILSPDVASQIAAGEVVERPASVVKELIENALDGGARTIIVDVEGGGRRRIRVADDGIGIPAAEAALAFARHATSKLAAAADLERITTLGFRGEALASIAAVSQVQFVTRAAGEVAGMRLRVEGGRTVARDSIGAPQGTVVTVENLFYNVPARLKFLKTDAAERARIDALVTRYALAYPERRFRLTHDGRLAFQSSGDGDRYATLIAVLGLDTARQMLALTPLPPSPGASGEGGVAPTSGLSPARGDGIEIAGYISLPSLSRSNRGQITLFVNGRWVQDSRLSYAIVEAYHGLLMVGRYPAAVVFITLPPEEVDVNVHPAKTEVRFRRPDMVFGAVQKTVRRTLLAHLPVPEIRPAPTWERPQISVEGEPVPGFSQAGSVERDREEAEIAPPSTLHAPQPLPLLRVVGQVGVAYIIAEGPDGMYLIDQHAAHERILYERFMAAAASRAVPSQTLLEPVVVDLPPEVAATLAEELDLICGLGFSVEPFGGTNFLVRAVPVLAARLDPAQALYTAIVDVDMGEPPLAGTREAQIIARVCKSAAVKAGQVLSAAEMQAMVRQLEACAAPRTCPHGRPTMIHLSTEQLARQFGRLG